MKTIVPIYEASSTCNSNQKALLNEILSHTLEVLDHMHTDATEVNENNAHSDAFAQAFGAINKKKVLFVLRRIHQMIDVTTIKILDCKGKGSRGSASAYSSQEHGYYLGTSILLSSDRVSEDLSVPTNYGTMIHELSHGICKTVDSEKGGDPIYYPSLAYNEMKDRSIIYRFADAYRVYAELVQKDYHYVTMAVANNPISPIVEDIKNINWSPKNPVYSGTELTINWDKVPNATAYDVQLICNNSIIIDFGEIIDTQVKYKLTQQDMYQTLTISIQAVSTDDVLTYVAASSYYTGNSQG